MKIEKERKLKKILKTLFEEGVYIIDNGMEAREIGQLFGEDGLNERENVIISYDQKRQKSVVVDDGLVYDRIFKNNYFHVTDLEDVKIA